MNKKTIISKAFQALLDSINSLSANDLDKLSSGDFKIELKFTKEKKSKSEKKQSLALDQDIYNLVIGKLNEAESRDDLDDLDDLDELSSGDFKIELKFTKEKKNKNEKKQSLALDQDIYNLVIGKLNEAESREEGIMILESQISLKSQLESFAKNIDVAIMKSDKVDSIKNRIVDATVGARLRSNAIQGKEI